MKRMILCAYVLFAIVSQMYAQGPPYPHYTIRQLQEVSHDSLLLADTLQRTNTRWTLQVSPHFHDTVTVTGVVVTPAKVINFTSLGYNLLVADTGSPNIWAGLFVRPNISSTSNPGDTSLAIAWGLSAGSPEAGDVVTLTGWLDEFPLNDMVSSTQIVPIYTQPLDIGPNPAPVPPHQLRPVSDFNIGGFPSGTIRFSTGEPYEWMRVTLTNLVVASYVNPTNGTFNLVDLTTGNMIATMDASKWFTLRGHRDPASTYVLPALNTQVDTIRGYITTNSGAEAARGYRIAPLLPGDIKYGVALQQVSLHRRNPVVVTSDSAARLSVKVTRGGSGIASVQLKYSVNNGPFLTLPMVLSDTTYKAQIPAQPDTTFVRYYIRTVDSLGNEVKFCSSALDGSASDTLKGFFFYRVTNRTLTIHDIQYTPYLNGRSPYQGAVVSIPGIVTADTANIGFTAASTGGTSSWYMQTGTQPSNGIWFVGLLDSLASLRNGDSALVTGTVAEDFDVTRLQNVSKRPTVYSTGHTGPAPIEFPTSNFGASSGNGNPAAEPWEGMLVQFNNVAVEDTAPVFNEQYEFTVNDGSGAVLVRRDGKNNYSQIAADTAAGKIWLRRGAHISYLRGIMYYSFNRYKIVPRTNADFGTITSVPYIEHEPGLPKHLALAQNYPNPFNPTTTIEYSLPAQDIVTVRIYNVLGQEVKTLVNEVQSPGEYKVHFDAGSMASGLYFYSVRAGQSTQVKKMLLLK